MSPRKSLTALVIPAEISEPDRLMEVSVSSLTVRTGTGPADLEQPSQAVDLPGLGAVLYALAGQAAGSSSLNLRATALAQFHAVPPNLQIYGPALLLGPDEGDLRVQDVPITVADLLLRTETYRLEIRSLARPRSWTRTSRVFGSWYPAYVRAIKLRAVPGVVGQVRVVPALTSDQLNAWVDVGRDHLAQQGLQRPFDRDDVVAHEDLKDLAQAIGTVKPTAGCAFRYRDLCLINRLDDRDSWIGIVQGSAIHLGPLNPRIQDGTFEDLIIALTVPLGPDGSQPAGRSRRIADTAAR